MERYVVVKIAPGHKTRCWCARGRKKEVTGHGKGLQRAQDGDAGQGTGS